MINQSPRAGNLPEISLVLVPDEDSFHSWSADRTRRSSSRSVLWPACAGRQLHGCGTFGNTSRRKLLAPNGSWHSYAGCKQPAKRRYGCRFHIQSLVPSDQAHPCAARSYVESEIVEGRCHILPNDRIHPCEHRSPRGSGTRSHRCHIRTSWLEDIEPDEEMWIIKRIIKTVWWIGWQEARWHVRIEETMQRGERCKMEREWGCGQTGFCFSHSKRPSNRVRAGTSSSLEGLLFLLYLSWPTLCYLVWCTFLIF